MEEYIFVVVYKNAIAVRDDDSKGFCDIGPSGEVVGTLSEAQLCVESAVRYGFPREDYQIYKLVKVES